MRIGSHEAEVGDSVPLTPASENLKWYFNTSSRSLDYIVANQKADARRKRSASSDLGIVDENIDNIVVSPRIYR